MSNSTPLKNLFSFLVLHVVLILYCETHIHYTIAVYTIKKFVLICICVIQPHKIFLVLGSFFSARAHYFYTQVLYVCWFCIVLMILNLYPLVYFLLGSVNYLLQFGSVSVHHNRPQPLQA